VTDNSPVPLSATEPEFIRFDCPHCGKHIRATPGSAGKRFYCYKCGKTLSVPTADGHKPSPPSPGVRSWALWLGGLAALVTVANALLLNAWPRAESPAAEPLALADAEPAPEEENPLSADIDNPSAEQEKQPPADIPVAAAAPEKKEPPAVATPSPAEDDAEATYKLGLRYETGDAIEEDTAAAAMCYEEAANGGHAESMYKIGLCYCVGKGVEKDEDTGKEWLNEAAKLGHPDARLALQVLETGAPPLALLAAGWATRPVGEGLRQADKDKAMAEAANRPSPEEIAERRMALVGRVLGALSGNAAQPNRYVQGFQMQQRNALHSPNSSQARTFQGKR
jgi:TPR repeat protein